MSSFSCNHSTIIILYLIYLIIIDPLASETINCENEWSASECREETISCTNTSSSCSINCNADGSCGGATLNCNENTNAECIVHCTGEASCRGIVSESTINCASNSQCSIHCDGLHSCEDINIHCPSTANCTVYGNGQYGLINAWIGCDSGDGGCILDINCDGIHSCHDARIDGQNASKLNIICTNNKNSCKNINIKCPEAKDGEKHCTLQGDEGTVHTEMRLYAVNSWDDIDLSTYVATTTSSGTLDSMMFCGSTFDEACGISLSAWNCADESSICYRSDINPYPTPRPTASPTQGDGSTGAPPEITSWAAIIGIVLGLVIFVLFVILGYVWCLKQKQEMDTKYETVDQNADPDADIMDKETQHMYRTNVPQTKDRKSMDIETKGGFHIVNEYSDASKFGGLLPISEDKSRDIFSEKKMDDVVEGKEEEKETLILGTKDRQSVVITEDSDNEKDIVQNEQQ